jgi:hypothetical protein
MWFGKSHFAWGVFIFGLLIHPIQVIHCQDYFVFSRDQPFGLETSEYKELEVGDTEVQTFLDDL